MFNTITNLVLNGEHRPTHRQTESVIGALRGWWRSGMLYGKRGSDKKDLKGREILRVMDGEETIVWLTRLDMFVSSLHLLGTLRDLEYKILTQKNVSESSTSTRLIA